MNAFQLKLQKNDESFFIALELFLRLHNIIEYEKHAASKHCHKKILIQD